MLKIHFLNVGHGDCTIIKHHSGRITMIDINNATDLDEISIEELSQNYNISLLTRTLMELSGITPLKQFQTAGYKTNLTNPIEFLLANYPGEHIFRFILTHPDLDHMRGLAALRSSGIKIYNFWDTKHDKVPEFQSKSDEDEWKEYQDLRSGNRCTVLYLRQGSQSIYFNQEPKGIPGGDGIEILAPTPDLIKKAAETDNYNLLSYVLKLTYRGFSFIFGGDADPDVWEFISGYHGGNLKCSVLKASHHGRDSGYHQEALKLMEPEYTIVSVGKKPESDASNKYRQYSGNVWSTRWKGNITLTIDDYGKGTIDSECN